MDFTKITLNTLLLPLILSVCPLSAHADTNGSTRVERLKQFKAGIKAESRVRAKACREQAKQYTDKNERSAFIRQCRTSQGTQKFSDTAAHQASNAEG